MNLQKYLIGLSLTLFGTGIIMAAPLGISYLEQQNAPASTSVVIPAKKVVSDNPEITQGTPRHVSVPSVGVDTAIVDGFYAEATGEWTLNEESAFFATPTNPVNSEGGNTLIYGHNSQKIFGNLLNLQVGAEVTVTTDNGYEFVYTYMSTEALNPTDVSLFAYTGKPRLTLQTCSGAWNEHRQMFYFDLKSYKKL